MILTSNDTANALLMTPEVVRKMVKSGEISISNQSAGGNYEFSLKDIREYIKKENYQLPCSVISFANIKHRTGKTMFTICVSEVLNYLGYRVLVIDCDKQGDLSRFYLGQRSPANMPLITDIFYGHFPDGLIIDTSQGVHLVASNLQHSQIHSLSSPQAYTNLHDYIEHIKSNYDFILLDMHPDTGLQVLAPLVASDRTFCIITPDPSSFEGINYLYTAVNTANQTFSGRRPVFFKSCIVNNIPGEIKIDKNELKIARAKGLEREIVYPDRFGKIVKREKRTFNVFYHSIPGSEQYRQFYLAGANREKPTAAFSFFDSHLLDIHKNSFVYVTLEMMAELRDHAVGKRNYKANTKSSFFNQKDRK